MPSARYFVHVSFADKAEAQALGARWDRKEKRWYAPDQTTYQRLAKWHKPRTVMNKEPDWRIKQRRQEELGRQKAERARICQEQRANRPPRKPWPTPPAGYKYDYIFDDEWLGDVCVFGGCCGSMPRLVKMHAAYQGPPTEEDVYKGVWPPPEW